MLLGTALAGAGCGDGGGGAQGRAGADPFTAVSRESSATKTARRAAPRWERVARFEGWLGGLLMLNAPDVFRIKAILSLAGEPRRQIVHGVQTYVEQAPGSEWPAGDRRASRIVVIGRNLETEQWRAELERCVVG